MTDTQFDIVNSAEISVCDFMIELRILKHVFCITYSHSANYSLLKASVSCDTFCPFVNLFYEPTDISLEGSF